MTAQNLKRALAAALLLLAAPGAQAGVEGDVGPLDARLTQPRNPVALNAGTWDGGREDDGGNVPRLLDFNKAGFSGFRYSECFFTKNLHTQHVVRLPNKNGKAYFMVSNSDYKDQSLGTGVDRVSAGRLSIYEAPNVDPVTDLVQDVTVDGQIVWEQEFTPDSPIGAWNHPGKMEVIGRLLLVSAENWAEWTQGFCGDAGEADDRDAILFYDVRDPASPKYWGKLDTYELGRIAVQTLDRNGDGGLDLGESGLTQEGFDERNTTQAHWVDDVPVPYLVLGLDGLLDSTEVIPVVNNVSLIESGDEWVLHVANFFFRTKHVSPDIGSWQGFAGTAIYPYFTNSHGQHFNSIEQYFAPQVEPTEYGPSDLNQPGDKRPMWFDGSANDGSESFSFSQVEFSPPPSSSPTDTTSVLKRILSFSRLAPNLYFKDNDYDAAGIYVTRRGATVIYSPLQNYPNGTCSLIPSACNASYDCPNFPIEHCNSGSTDTIYQIDHPYNIGFGQNFIVTNENDSGPGSLRAALAVVPAGTKIIIASHLDAETIFLESELVISNDVEIDASGLENGITLERSGGDFFRILEIQAGATVSMDNLTITKGYASGLAGEEGFGGGILNRGNLTLDNCKVYSNQSDVSGGGIASWFSSSLVLNNTVVDSNSSGASGAGIYSLAADSLSLSYSTIQNNNIFSVAQRDGGGIYFNGQTLSVDRSSISGNNATGRGGGIYTQCMKADIKDSALRGNGGDGSTRGGGLYFRKDPSTGVPGVGLTISGSTFSGNRATEKGGGIFYTESDFGLIENTTIANNASVASPGAGIWTEGANTALTLRHVTVAGNTMDPTAPLTGTGVNSASPSALVLENCLVADNRSLLGNSNVDGNNVTTLGANLVEGGIDGILVSGPAPLTGDPRLTPLADNGGSTQTVMPEETSPAIDAALGTATSIDQRGISRPLGPASDLGAVERGSVEISVEQSGVVLVDGVTSVTFDAVAPGGSSVHTFSIRNASTGKARLTGLAVSVDGPSAAAFSVNQPALTDLAAESRASFEVIFTPTSAEMHSAEIHVASNDADEPLFDIALRGPGGTPIAATAGLVYHLDAALRVVQAFGGVASWGDSRRNGVIFDQTETAARWPVYIDGTSAGNINGRPVVRFDGDLSGASGGVAPGADQLSYASAVGVCGVSGQLCSTDSPCPLVVEICNLGESVQTLVVVARTLSFNFLDGLWGSTPDVGLRRANASNWIHGGNGNDFSFGGSLVVNREAVSSSSNNNLSPLGEPEIIVATRGSSARFATTRIGDYFRVGTNAPRPWHGDIAEIAVFDHALTAQELEDIQAHLETKYGIAPPCNAVIDGDCDGIPDSSDLCPFWAQLSNADSDADGRGDACECGDQSGDGRNTVSDLVAIKLAIFSPALATPLCDADNDGLCNVMDIIAVNSDLFSPTSDTTCARQPVTGP